MRVLIGCESHGRTRDAFLALGHDAMSCDLLPTKTPGPHYQGNVLDIINDGWDMAIFHPDCTYLCGSGLHWNNRGRGWEKTDAALDFVRDLFAAPIKKKAIENPIGLIGTRIRKATQWIQPNQFGHDASKKTGLWLENLEPLVPTMQIEGRLVEWPKGSGKFVRRWANQTDSGQNKLPPSANRWELRAETYQGWSDAMALQWGGRV